MLKVVAGLWYSLIFFLVVLGALTGVIEHYSYQGGWNNAPLIAKIGIPTVYITFIGFWVLMLEDLIENSTIKHRMLIAFSMFFFHCIAILFYFWLVVFRRKKQTNMVYLQE